jgi:hypothetical protein
LQCTLKSTFVFAGLTVSPSASKPAIGWRHTHQHKLLSMGRQMGIVSGRSCPFTWPTLQRPPQHGGRGGGAGRQQQEVVHQAHHRARQLPASAAAALAACTTVDAPHIRPRSQVHVWRKLSKQMGGGPCSKRSASRIRCWPRGAGPNMLVSRCWPREGAQLRHAVQGCNAITSGAVAACRRLSRQLGGRRRVPGLAARRRRQQRPQVAGLHVRQKQAAQQRRQRAALQRLCRVAWSHVACQLFDSASTIAEDRLYSSVDSVLPCSSSTQHECTWQCQCQNVSAMQDAASAQCTALSR